jgi:hypothetical protein
MTVEHTHLYRHSPVLSTSIRGCPAAALAALAAVKALSCVSAQYAVSSAAALTHVSSTSTAVNGGTFLALAAVTAACGKLIAYSGSLWQQRTCTNADKGERSSVSLHCALAQSSDAAPIANSAELDESLFIARQ